MTTKRWVVIGAGPSLTVEDVNAVRGEKVCVINTGYQIAPWADLLYACDAQWWDWHKDSPELLAFKGEKWTQTAGWEEHGPMLAKILPKHAISVRASKPGEGIAECGPIFQGANSGIQAINLVYQLHRPEQIILLGYDMQGSQTKPRWHGKHPSGVVCSNWHAWVPLYDAVARDAKRLGVEIVNCSRETALTCFPRARLEDYLQTPS